MHIALLTDGIFPYVIGGMQKHSYYLAKYLAFNGVQVDLYHTSFRSSVTDAIKNTNCFTEEEKKYIRPVLVDFPCFAPLPGHYLRESYEYSCRIFKLFSQTSNVDFIYAKGFTAWKLIEEKIKGYKCPAIGVNFHGYEMFQKAPSLKSSIQQKLFLQKPALYNMLNADYVFSYGGKITDIIAGTGISRKQIIEIPAGIEESWLSSDIKPSGRQIKFLFVGRYERRKGIEELNRALKKIINEYDFEFHFAGDIPERKKIKSDKIFYHGSIRDAEKIKSIYSGCDILVCPSWSEGMPNVILEAMASGLAIIATDVGAVSEMVSNENGWLINSPEPEKIKYAIVNAINLSEKDFMKMKDNSVKKGKNFFLWEQIIRKLIEDISKRVKQ